MMRAIESGGLVRRKSDANIFLEGRRTLSGRRLHRDERSAQPVRGTGEHCSRVEGGGYVDLTTPLMPSGSRHVLLPAHGVVVRAVGTKRAARPGCGRALQWEGEKEVPPDFRSS